MLLPDEKAFVGEELKKWAPFLVERLKSQLTSRNISVNGPLLHSVVADVADDKQVDLSFLKYGRFHDMGAKRGWHKGQFVGHQQRGERLRPPKPSKFYSRTGWGTLTTLINNLQNTYVARLQEDIHQSLTNNGNA